MKRRLLSLVLALILIASILPVTTAAAATKAYGTVYALYQPVVFDWSAYAGYGTLYNCAIINVKTQEITSYTEKTTDTITTFIFREKGSFCVYIECLDASGNKTKTISDFFHVGAVLVEPTSVPTEKIVMKGILAKDAKKYPAFSQKHLNAIASIIGLNPNFQNRNNDADTSLWLNKEKSNNFTIDVFSVVSRGYSTAKYSYNYTIEAEMYEMINQYRAQNGKPALIWNDNLAAFARLRVTAACDNPFKDGNYDLSEIDGHNILDPDFLRYGLYLPAVGSEWYWNMPDIDWKSKDAALAIFDSWLSNDELREDLLSDYKYLGIGAVKCSKLRGKKLTGIALMVELEN